MWVGKGDTKFIRKGMDMRNFIVAAVATSIAGSAFAQTQPTRPSAYRTIPTMPSAWATAASKAFFREAVR